MSIDEYRKMSATRMETWRRNNPEAYAEARNRNREAVKFPEREAKRKASRFAGEEFDLKAQLAFPDLDS